MKKSLIASAVPFVFLASLVANEKPNVLFIAIDDLNDWVGCLKGHPQVKTPNIDRLASMGMLFTNAHCQAPVSGPSRASVMTGLYPSTSGNYFQLQDTDIKASNDITAKADFMPDYFEKFGYKTMAVGKIYHNGDGAETFDLYGGTFDKFGPRPEKRMNYDPKWFPEKEGATQTDWGPFPESDELMPDYKSAKWAIDRLQESHEKPFFLAVGFIRPHVPWHVPQKWFDLFPLESIITPPYNPHDFDDIPPLARKITEAPMMPTTEWLIQTNQWREVIQAYLACIAFVDAQLGKVIDALEKSDYSSNTIIVLWSDHGYHLGEKNRFAKQAIWERTTRTPLIFKIPGYTASQKCTAPVQLVDIYPTLLELCGLAPYQLADGHSLVPLMKNPESQWPYTALSFYGTGNIAVRDYRYRLIQYADNSYELYDIKRDPNEWINLAGKRKYQRVIKKMETQFPIQWAKTAPEMKFNFNRYFRETYK